MRTKRTTAGVISAAGIARILKRSRQGVLDAIGRLGLSPEVETPNARYYSRDTIEVVRKGMRKPNGARSTHRA